MTTSREDVFLKKVKEYDSLIRYAAKRYKISGVVDPDDLYQEGLFILDECVRKSSFEPDSSDFRKMFKTKLWHGLGKAIHKRKAKKRTWKKILNEDFSQLERLVSRSHDYSSSSELGASVEDFYSAKLNPEQSLELREEVNEVDKFLELLVDRLDDDARIVLYELLYPREWSDIPEDCIANAFGDEYWRVPKKIPKAVIARAMDWPLTKFRRAVSRVRKQSKILGEELGIDIIVAAKAKRSRRRKRNA